MNMTMEELKTFCGTLMLDLRGDWSSNYSSHMEDLIEKLELIRDHPDASSEDINMAESDIKLTEGEMDSLYDGRIFRDYANFYGYQSEDGLTQIVKEELEMILEYPELYLAIFPKD